MVFINFHAQAGFTDLASDSKYYDAVSNLVSLGVMKGYTDGSVKANENITRAQAAVLVMRSMVFDDASWSKSTIPLYSDVPLSNWASGYIYAAKSRGIIDGFEDNTFRADSPVTYEQMVKMIVIQ